MPFHETKEEIDQGRIAELQQKRLRLRQMREGRAIQRQKQEQQQLQQQESLDHDLTIARLYRELAEAQQTNLELNS